MFVSGAAALLFETLWFRQAGLAFGNSVWASALVLAAFMGGLAVGNAIIARVGERIARPLLWYAGLEATIAATGVALVWALPLFGGWLVPLWQPILDQPWLLNPLRLGFGFALLLLPATAMGATLPILVKALRARDPNFGAVLGRLYGWNTLGAVAGALLGELVLIEWLGIRGTAFAAGALNGVAAVMSIAVARWQGPAPGPAVAMPTEGSAAVPGSALDRPAPLRQPAALLMAAALCGGVLLALEVVWFRFLHLFVLNTSASFAFVLAVVLAGIGLGGAFAGGWLRRRPEALAQVPSLAFTAGAVTLLAYLAFGPVAASYGAREIRYPLDILKLSAVLMLPVSLVSGALFTLTGAALERHVQPETRAAGWLTLANTLGGVAGSVMGGFVLLPWLGLEISIFALAALYGVAAGLLWMRARPG